MLGGKRDSAIPPSLDIIAKEPLDFIENDPSDLNENENEVTAHPQAIPVEKLEVKLNKSCSTHKKCFVCRNENDYTKLVSIKPAAAFYVCMYLFSFFNKDCPLLN